MPKNDVSHIEYKFTKAIEAQLELLGEKELKSVLRLAVDLATGVVSVPVTFTASDTDKKHDDICWK